MSLFGKIFETAGDLISIPFDVVSDVSRAVQGKQVGRTKERLGDLSDDLKEVVDDTLEGDII